MMASRRCTSADVPSSHVPSPSGPRCASAACMRSSAARSGARAGAQLEPEAAHGSGDRLLRAPGTPPRTRGTAGVRLADGVERLGVPLDGEHERRRRPRSPRSVPSGDQATARSPAPSRSTAWWWNELTASAVAPSAAARREPGSTRTSCVVTQPGSVWRCSTVSPTTSGRCWMQAPAARDVERLAAAADAEDRQPGGVGAAGDLELEHVEVGLDRAEVGCAVGAVGGGVDVRPAGQADGGERADQRRDQLARRPAGARRARRRRARARARTACRAPSRAAAARPPGAGRCAPRGGSPMSSRR